jgi:hypothetical protein
VDPELLLSDPHQSVLRANYLGAKSDQHRLPDGDPDDIAIAEQESLINRAPDAQVAGLHAGEP